MFEAGSQSYERKGDLPSNFQIIKCTLCQYGDDYGAGSNKYFDENFHLRKHFGQSWPVLGVAITATH